MRLVRSDASDAMLSLQEISDRLEIQQLMTDYASAIDRRDFEALDRVFTPDAHIDYRAMGGIHGDYPKIKSWLAQTLQWFPAYYHMLGNLSIVFDGDRATTRCICFNPMRMPLPGLPQPQTVFFGLWYIDELLRTPDGWRITRRSEEKCFDFNLPAQFAGMAGPP